MSPILIYNGQYVLQGGSFVSGVSSPASEPFVFTLETTASSESITIPHESGYTFDYTIDYGDGSVVAVNAYNDPNTTHVYSDPSIYTVSIEGTCENINFYYNTAAQKVRKVISWGTVGWKSLHFVGCYDLDEIPTDTAGSFTGVYSFSEFIEDTNVSTIPEGLFDYAVDASNMEYSVCYSPITSIPDNLLANNTKVTNLRGIFFGNPITTISKDIFANQVDAEDMSSVFAYCSSLASIDPSIFWNNTNVTNFTGVIQYTPMSSISEDIFANNPNVTSFERVVRGTKIESLPANIFANNPLVTNFSYVLANCSSLNSVDPSLFWNNPNVDTFQYAFQSSPLLTSIDGSMFWNNTAVTNFFGAFDQTNTPNGLTSIPAGLFDRNTAVQDFGQVFRSTNITSIPAGLFDNNDQVTSFRFLFVNCTSLTGSSGELWLNPSGAANYTLTGPSYATGVPNGQSCYNGCTGLSDYASIPAWWQ